MRIDNSIKHHLTEMGLSDDEAKWQNMLMIMDLPLTDSTIDNINFMIIHVCQMPKVQTEADITKYNDDDIGSTANDSTYDMKVIIDHVSNCQDVTKTKTV